MCEWFGGGSGPCRAGFDDEQQPARCSSHVLRFAVPRRQLVRSNRDDTEWTNVEADVTVEFYHLFEV